MGRIGHFRVPPGLCFKTRVDARPLIWKSFFILMQIKLIFTREIEHLASFWMWGFLELGSGLLCRIGVVSTFTLSRMSEVKKNHCSSFNSPEIKHLEDVGTISSWTGRQTVPTRLFKVAGLESWIKAMSLSSLLEEYPGWTITRLAFISCSVPSETRRLYSPKRTV